MLPHNLGHSLGADKMRVFLLLIIFFSKGLWSQVIQTNLYKTSSSSINDRMYLFSPAELKVIEQRCPRSVLSGFYFSLEFEYEGNGDGANGASYSIDENYYYKDYKSTEVEIGNSGPVGGISIALSQRKSGYFTYLLGYKVNVPALINFNSFFPRNITEKNSFRVRMYTQNNTASDSYLGDVVGFDENFRSYYERRKGSYPLTITSSVETPEFCTDLEKKINQSDFIYYKSKVFLVKNLSEDGIKLNIQTINNKTGGLLAPIVVNTKDVKKIFKCSASNFCSDEEFFYENKMVKLLYVIGDHEAVINNGRGSKVIKLNKLTRKL